MRPRWARLNEAVKEFDAILFQLTRPRGARLSSPNRLWITAMFQLTHPREARRSRRKLSLRPGLFQPTRPREARRIAKIYKYDNTSSTYFAKQFCRVCFRRQRSAKTQELTGEPRRAGLSGFLCEPTVRTFMRVYAEAQRQTRGDG